MFCVFQVWLRYQALWDLTPDGLYNRLGDLQTWMRTLEQIKLVGQ